MRDAGCVGAGLHPASRIPYHASRSPHPLSTGPVAAGCAGPPVARKGPKTSPLLHLGGGHTQYFAGFWARGGRTVGFALGSRGGAFRTPSPAATRSQEEVGSAFSYQVSHTTDVGEKPDEQAT